MLELIGGQSGAPSFCSLLAWVVIAVREPDILPPNSQTPGTKAALTIMASTSPTTYDFFTSLTKSSSLAAIKRLRLDCAPTVNFLNLYRNAAPCVRPIRPGAVKGHDT